MNGISKSDLEYIRKHKPAVLLTIHGTNDSTPVVPVQAADKTEQDSAKELKWWQRGSRFTQDIISGLQFAEELYTIPFIWSGDNDEDARLKASMQLAAQLRSIEYSCSRIDIIAHSHGGNVVEQAFCVDPALTKSSKIATISTFGTPFLGRRISWIRSTRNLASIAVLVLVAVYALRMPTTYISVAILFAMVLSLVHFSFTYIREALTITCSGAHFKSGEFASKWVCLQSEFDEIAILYFALHGRIVESSSTPPASSVDKIGNSKFATQKSKSSVRGLVDFFQALLDFSQATALVAIPVGLGLFLISPDWPSFTGLVVRPEDHLTAGLFYFLFTWVVIALSIAILLLAIGLSAKLFLLSSAKRVMLGNLLIRDAFWSVNDINLVPFRSGIVVKMLAPSTTLAISNEADLVGKTKYQEFIVELFKDAANIFTNTDDSWRLFNKSLVHNQYTRNPEVLSIVLAHIQRGQGE